jgi:hypothetical protein
LKFREQAADLLSNSKSAHPKADGNGFWIWCEPRLVGTFFVFCVLVLASQITDPGCIFRFPLSRESPE